MGVPLNHPSIDGFSTTNRLGVPTCMETNITMENHIFPWVNQHFFHIFPAFQVLPIVGNPHMDHFPEAIDFFFRSLP